MSDYYGYITGCTCSYCEEEHKREAADKAASEKVAAEAVATHPVPTERLLTLEMVLKGSPCDEYRDRFAQRYGENGVMVTVERALSESDDWDWGWAGAVLLSRKAKAEFSRRSREADKAYDEALRPYHDAVNAAYNKYYKALDAAWLDADKQQQLSYSEKVGVVYKVIQGILEIPNAAKKAAEEIAAERRSDARITAFAELFITDGLAYDEEHKNDEPLDLSVYDSDEDY